MQPDNCITIYNTSGLVTGRTMIDGRVFQKHGLQFRVRSKDHPTGWTRIDALSRFAQRVYEAAVHVTRDGVDSRYLIKCFVSIGNVLDLGKDANNSDRNLFTLNLMAAISPLS